MLLIHRHRCILHAKNVHSWFHFSWKCTKFAHGCKSHRKWWDNHWTPEELLPKIEKKWRPTAQQKRQGYKEPSSVLSEWDIMDKLSPSGTYERLTELTELQKAIAEEIRTTQYVRRENDSF